MEELLVVGAEVVKVAFAAVPVFRELLGFCDLVSDSVDACNAGLSLFALLGGKVFQACAEHVHDRRAYVFAATNNGS